jgi:diguanylate cyclase (GGDEF)-like protein
VPKGLEEEVRKAMLVRPFPVENAAGFCGLEILKDAANVSVFLLLTRWTDGQSLHAWNRSETHLRSSETMFSGVTLDATFTSVSLLETQKYQHDSQFRTEILRLTNDLSVRILQADSANRELKEANGKIERLARTDSLTGLANRRTLFETMQREIRRAERLHESLSVVLADLDHFKSINDQYGHLAGDHVLASTAAVFGSQSRPYDLAARYGGEEFVLLLPATTTDGAVAVAQRMRKKIAEMRVPECPAQISVSFGVATWIAGETLEQLVGRADVALYAAKGAGRNRVEVAVGVRV